MTSNITIPINTNLDVIQQAQPTIYQASGKTIIKFDELKYIKGCGFQEYYFSVCCDRCDKNSMQCLSPGEYTIINQDCDENKCSNEPSYIKKFCNKEFTIDDLQKEFDCRVIKLHVSYVPEYYHYKFSDRCHDVEAHYLIKLYCY